MDQAVMTYEEINSLREQYGPFPYLWKGEIIYKCFWRDSDGTLGRTIRYIDEENWELYNMIKGKAICTEGTITIDDFGGITQLEGVNPPTKRYTSREKERERRRWRDALKWGFIRPLPAQKATKKHLAFIAAWRKSPNYQPFVDDFINDFARTSKEIKEVKAMFCAWEESPIAESYFDREEILDLQKIMGEFIEHIDLIDSENRNSASFIALLSL